MTIFSVHKWKTSAVAERSIISQQACLLVFLVLQVKDWQISFFDFLSIEERPPTSRLIWNACKSNFRVATARLCMRIFYCFSTTKLILKFQCGCDNTWYMTSRFFGVSRERKTIAEYWITFSRRNLLRPFFSDFKLWATENAANVATNDCRKFS